jgi:predicted RNA-binding Zn-ribbon protein involved in translation (DUF1610 family)
MPREIDWRAWLNRLKYCYGCGKFGIPRQGTGKPMGWRVLYQPHPDAPPGLHVCSESCADDVRDAMQKGPVTEPLKIGPPPMMDADLRRQMMDEMTGEVEQQLVNEAPFAFDCHSCEVRIDPQGAAGIPMEFDCPNCGAKYKTVPVEVHVATRPDEPMGPSLIRFERRDT